MTSVRSNTHLGPTTVQSKVRKRVATIKDIPVTAAPKMASLKKTAKPIAFPAANDDFRAARKRAAVACQKYNAVPEEADKPEREQAWHNIIDRDPSDVGTTTPAAPYVKGPVWIDYGLRLEVGNTTFINRGFILLDTPVADVKIGEYCLFGPNVSIYCVGHPLCGELRLGGAEYERMQLANLAPSSVTSAHQALTMKGGTSLGWPVTIGDRVWVGGGTTILGGVTIGDDVVIGAGSIVTTNIPSGHMAVGSPARIIRKVGPGPNLGFPVHIEEEPASVISTLEEALRKSNRRRNRMPERAKEVSNGVKIKSPRNIAEDMPMLVPNGIHDHHHLDEELKEAKEPLVNSNHGIGVWTR